MAAPQQPAETPRRNRGFSVKSDNSRRTSTSGHKSHHSESSEEKARRNLHTKADPTVAMNELQPMAVALEASNLGSLRDIQHKDQFGNPIVDPDWSNPTRARFERPLDTIRSFEAAIYGTYKSQRPNSYARTGSLRSFLTTPVNPTQGTQADFDFDFFFQQRMQRHKWVQLHKWETSVDEQVITLLILVSIPLGPQANMNRGYSEQSANYGRGTQSRPDSVIDYGASSSQAQPQTPDSHYPYNQSGGGQRRPRHAARASNDQAFYGSGGNSNAQNTSTQQQNYHRSNDNVTANSGSAASTDPYGQSTDPSSMNSSMDQLQQQALHQQRLDERAQAEYGFQGFGGGPNFNASGMPVAPVPAAGSSYGQSQPQQGKANAIRKPVNNEKRKSWLKRRFSKD
ncbi:hypothetical protein N7478_002182 [Penicillium angulare]|uniref:uncharacterized protein n=1 Tax=Penicillium angulare TaxID=116970 RepID=UPI00253FED14|nr:uncharacterized protein N7478_002182 [Penicillium angulare]KAJ5289152.1 hypothetical protein N7478_002182 [Penicillium angulare]